MKFAFSNGNTELRSYTEIDLLQIEKNYLNYKALVKNKEIMAVVKADAYGHGAVEVAKRLENLGVSIFATATLDEAAQLRRSGIFGDILVLGYTHPKLADRLYELDITQTLLSEKYADALARSTDKILKCHVAINTGMNRIGLHTANNELLCEQIHGFSKRFDIRGIYTHLACAASGEEEDVIFTKKQLDRFSSVLRGTRDLKIPSVHCLNSAGGLSYDDYAPAEANIIRLGILLYGLAPSENYKFPSGILPALSWKCILSHILSVDSGERIGYGKGCITDKKTKVGVLSCGYADGYKRCLSSRAEVLVGGARARILGNICMDQIMVDLSDIDAEEGSVVTLIGKSGAEWIFADTLAKLADTIGYEIVTGISSRVKRTYLN